jgi:hypothetical protein
MDSVQWTTRQTRILPEYATEFLHHVLVGRVPMMDPADAPTGPPSASVASCLTPKPAARCECGMYDLKWTARRGPYQ